MDQVSAPSRHPAATTRRRRRPRVAHVAPALLACAAALVLSGCEAGPAASAPAVQVSVPPAPSSSATAAPSRVTPTPSTAPAAAKPTQSPTSSPPKAPAAGTALRALATVPVKGRAPKTGYSREQFGQRWADTDHNGCDARNDILVRDLTNVTFKPGTRDCVVLTGTLRDPYTGSVIAFTRGQTSSMAVQIDHVVALSNAWQTGAQKLDAATRQKLANDPLNLLAVDGPTNAAKSDGDAATWLPPAKVVRCAYVARQVAVKVKYHLWVTKPEKAAIERILTTCPKQALPKDNAGAPHVKATGSMPAPSKPASTPDGKGTDPRFATCALAVAVGYGPYTVGTDPEASWYRDGDGDGRVCE